MIPAERGPAVRRRLARLLRSMELEDLEERVAPVKCAKHPDSPECADEYGVPVYGDPEYGVPVPAYAVPPPAPEAPPAGGGS